MIYYLGFSIPGHPQAKVLGQVLNDFKSKNHGPACEEPHDFYQYIPRCS